MSTPAHVDGLPGLVLEAADEPVLEAVALRATCAAAAGWPADPGSVARPAGGDADVLHHAPGRWLLRGDAARAPRALAAAAAGECVLVDVTGKWQALRAGGAEALRRLGHAANLAALLEGRECAAATLFDCPVILVRDGAGYVAWLRRSYVEAFLTALRQARGA